MISIGLPIVVLCPEAPRDEPAWLPASDTCPYCERPLSEHDIRTFEGKPIREPS